MNDNIPNEKYFEEMRVKTISDFKWAVKYGAEIEIEWNNRSYFINQPNGYHNHTRRRSLFGSKGV